MKTTLPRSFPVFALLPLFIFLITWRVPLIAAEPKWWKGNLHTHSLWSDGNDYSESIVRWYKENGYHFLALSDHNVFQTGQRWIDATDNAGGEAALNRYLAEFGSNWVEL